MNTPDINSSGNFFDSIYHSRPPWDVGEAQPALIALLDEFPPAGPVLDVGCGTGDLALAVARRGYSVLGVDLAGAAIAQAQAKAAVEAPMVRRLLEFRVGNVLKPTQTPGPFGAVVDSGFYHLFDSEERQAFVAELAKTLITGGRHYLLGFAIMPQHPNAPKQVREDELRGLFTVDNGWRILALRPAGFLVNREVGKAQIPAVAMCAERIADNRVDG